MTLRFDEIFCDLSGCPNHISMADFNISITVEDQWSQWNNKDLCPEHRLEQPGPVDEWAALSPAMRAAIFEVMKVIGAKIID